MHDRKRPVVVLQVVLPDRALCLPTFSHLLIVNKSGFMTPVWLMVMHWGE